MHPILEALFGSLEPAGVAWCLLRGEAGLDGRRGDVDLLVGRGDLNRLCDLARRLGFARLPAPGYGSHVFLLTVDGSTGEWLKLDVVTDFAFGPYFSLRLGAAEGCLRQRRRLGAGPAFVLAPDDGFWALLLHCLLDKRTVAGYDAARLQELARENPAGGELARSIRSVTPPAWRSDRVLDMVERADWPGLIRMGDELAATWRRRRPADVAIRRLQGAVGRRAAAGLRWRRPRGLVVALVGPASASGPLIADLRRTRYLPISVVRPGGRPALRGLRMRLRRSSGLVIVQAGSIEQLPALRPRAGAAHSPLAWWRWLSFPTPDLVILLDAGRRQDTGAIGGSGPAVHAVDATPGIEQVRGEVMTLIWRELVRRWKGLERPAADE